MKIQFRAECSICGSDHAVDRAGRVADHGFTLRYGFRNRLCSGSGYPHYGTERGRELLQKEIGWYEEKSATYQNEDPKVQARTRREYARAAEYLRKRLEGWKPAEPREVRILEKPATVHFAGKRYGVNASVCVASRMGALRFRGQTTTDPEKVTCARCAKWLAR